MSVKEQTSTPSRAARGIAFSILLSLAFSTAAIGQRRIDLGAAVSTALGTALSKAFSAKSRKLDSIELPIDYPPEIELGVEKIAFSTPEAGGCATILVDSLKEIFVNNGLQVVDRSHLDKLLEEQAFNLDSGLVSKQDALKYGEILGPMALIIVNERLCDSDEKTIEEPRRDASGNPYLEYKAITTAYIKASVQVIDLSTAQIYSAKAIDEQESLAYSQIGRRPPYPAVHEVRSLVIDKAAMRIHQLFFPWTDRVSIPFWKKPGCGSALAYDLANAGDYSRALSEAQQDATLCASAKPKHNSKVLYNLGISYLVNGHVDLSESTLIESLRTRKDDTTTEALALARSLAGDLPQQAGGDTTVAPPAQPVEEVTIETRLQEVRGLYDDGLLTEDQFDTRVKTILDEMSGR